MAMVRWMTKGVLVGVSVAGLAACGSTAAPTASGAPSGTDVHGPGSIATTTGSSPNGTAAPGTSTSTSNTSSTTTTTTTVGTTTVTSVSPSSTAAPPTTRGATTVVAPRPTAPVTAAPPPVETTAPAPPTTTHAPTQYRIATTDISCGQSIQLANDGPGPMHYSISQKVVGLLFSVQGGDSGDVPPDGQFHDTWLARCTANFTPDKTAAVNVGYGWGDWTVTIHRS